MTELIKVTEENGSKLVSARELYEFLEVKSKFADWIKNRIEKYGFEENQDFVTLSKNLENGGREIDYILKIDMAKELSMVENNDKGRQARKYFIEIEKKFVALTPKSEEAMLLELFPTAPQNLLSLTAHNIREVKKLTQEVIYKEDVIVGLVENIDLATKRQRITQIVRHNSKNYQDRYNLLYDEFSKKFHVNLKMRLESDFALSIKPKIKKKMDLIERGLLINGQHRNMIPELYEIACKVFENNIKELVKEWESVVVAINFVP